MVVGQQLELEPSSSGRFDDGNPADLRLRAGRGTLVNAAFMVGASAIALLQGIVLARVLPTTVLGDWGLLLAAFMTLLSLAAVGVDDKYIQQDDPDQERAFQIAFTMQALLGALFVAVMLVGMPLLALLYGRASLVGPGLSLALAIPALVLQVPLWTHYRRMDFARQRRLQLIDPIVTFIATLALAVLGFGLWGLIAGAMIGTWAASLVIARTSRYPLRFRWDREAFRSYRSFSWPLFVAAGSTVLLIQVPVTISSHVYGVTAVAGLALVTNISRFSHKVDDLVTQTLYPAVCAVRHRSDLLYESFWKSNRIALLWAAPIGTGVALFAADLVHFVLGEKWRFATTLIGAFGLTAVIDQVAFNWSIFFRALNRTRPVAVGAGCGFAAVMLIAVPFLVIGGLSGYGIGMGAAALLTMMVRLAYLRQIFGSQRVFSVVLRGAAPTIPPALLVLGLRLLTGPPTSGVVAAAELLLYLGSTAGMTVALEGDLLRESIGYLRRGRRAVAQ